MANLLDWYNKTLDKIDANKVSDLAIEQATPLPTALPIYIRKSDNSPWTLVCKYPATQYPVELRGSSRTIHITRAELWDNYEKEEK